jgi:hypothetical protein
LPRIFFEDKQIEASALQDHLRMGKINGNEEDGSAEDEARGG